MFIKKIPNLHYTQYIDSTKFATNLAYKKGTMYHFFISDIALSAALILKQEAISVGGDFLLPKNSILCKEQLYSGILIATHRSLEQIIDKCAIQPFGLKQVAAMLQSHLQSHISKKQIMGVINITEDSFYADSRVLEVDSILQRIYDFIQSGATIIDIGGASSRPGSEKVESSVELGRIKDAILAIEHENLTQKATFSIDSYNYETIKFCLEHGFHIINDVYALQDRRLIDLALDFTSSIVVMHNSLITPHSDDIIQSVDDFFAQILDILEQRGIEKERIILDIGFGFGKNSQENLTLVKELEHFKHFGCDLLVGASRKRTIGEITDKETNDRLAGTLALHQIAFMNGADIIRSHDVREHIDMLKIIQSMAN